MDDIALIVIFGIASFYLTRLIRTTNIGMRMVVSAKKPVSCNVCMSFWMSLFLITTYYFFFNIDILDAVIYLLPSSGISLILLDLVNTSIIREGDLP